MEKQLKQLFDYQRFASNPKLQAVINSVRSHRTELALDEAALVSAAGAAYRKQDDNKDKTL